MKVEIYQERDSVTFRPAIKITVMMDNAIAENCSGLEGIQFGLATRAEFINEFERCLWPQIENYIIDIRNAVERGRKR